MRDDWMIAIPSRGRAQHLLTARGNFCTLVWMHDSCRDATRLFVRRDELANYEPVVERHGTRLEVVEDEDGMRGARDSILSWATRQGLERVIMMDDDLQLDHKPDARTYVRMIGGAHFDEMVRDLLAHCSEERPVVGIVARQFSQDRVANWEDDDRVIQVIALHLPTIAREGVTFSQFGMICMTDYAFVLEMLRRGYHNRVLSRYCRDDRAQMTGGCETYRTALIHSRSALRLRELFPDVVSLYSKTSSSWSEPRVNARIAWKRAFRERRFS